MDSYFPCKTFSFWLKGCWYINAYNEMLTVEKSYRSDVRKDVVCAGCLSLSNNYNIESLLKT
jgi:hypothetical protein